MERRQRSDAQGIPRSLQAVLRGRLERAAVRGRLGRTGPAAPGLHPGAGNVEELEHELLALPAADAGGDRGAAPQGVARAQKALSAQDGRGPLDRHHEPDRAAGRLGPVAGAYARRAPGRSLPDLRPEDLHHLRRARHEREHRASGARAHARGARGREGHLALRGAEVRAQRGRHPGQAQRREMRLDRAQARHPRQSHRGDGVRQGRGLSRRRGKPRPRVHVHHDERRALRRRPRGRGDLRARLPARAGVRQGAHAGARPGRRPHRADHPPPRRAADADADEVADRGDARAGLYHGIGNGLCAPAPRCRDAQAAPGVRRPDDPGGEGLVDRDRHRGGLARGAGARRHGLRRGNRRRAISARRAHHHHLRGHDRHPGDGPRRAQDRARSRSHRQGVARVAQDPGR